MAKFRETNWFKRGELVEGTSDEERVELPIEDRYSDDGKLTGVDSVLYGVHTGETARIPTWLMDATNGSCEPDPRFASAVIACDPSAAPELQKLIRELQQRNRTIVAMCGAAMLVVAVFVAGVL
jgi:hypothetical protein